MRTSQEIEEFRTWYSGRNHDLSGLAGLAFGAMKSQIDVAALRGDTVARKLPRGTLLLCDDRLVFLRKKGPGVLPWLLCILGGLVLLVGGSVVAYHTNRTPVIAIGVGAGLMFFFMQRLYQSKINLNDVAKVLAAAEDVNSMFIDLATVQQTEVAVRPGIMLRPNLTILEITFTRPDGQLTTAVLASRTEKASGKTDFDVYEWDGQIRQRIREIAARTPGNHFLSQT